MQSPTFPHPLTVLGFASLSADLPIYFSPLMPPQHFGAAFMPRQNA